MPLPPSVPPLTFTRVAPSEPLTRSVPVSTLSAPEKLLVPFRIKVPGPPLLKALVPERRPLRFKVFPGLFGPTDHVCAAPMVTGVEMVTLWFPASTSDGPPHHPTA